MEKELPVLNEGNIPFSGTDKSQFPLETFYVTSIIARE
jgi:hypothetical protein